MSISVLSPVMFTLSIYHWFFEKYSFIVFDFHFLHFFLVNWNVFHWDVKQYVVKMFFIIKVVIQCAAILKQETAEKTTYNGHA